MSASTAVKYLRISPWETAHCSLCQRQMEGRCMLVRSIDDQGRLKELLLFCGVGCRIAYAALNDATLLDFFGGTPDKPC